MKNKNDKKNEKDNTLKLNMQTHHQNTGPARILQVKYN